MTDGERQLRQEMLRISGDLARLDPSNPDDGFQRANFLEAQGDLAKRGVGGEPAPYYRKALEALDLWSPEPNVRRAILFWKLNDEPRFRDELDRGIDVHCKTLSNWWVPKRRLGHQNQELALSYLLAGQAAESVQYAEAWAHLRPAEGGPFLAVALALRDRDHARFHESLRALVGWGSKSIFAEVGLGFLPTLLSVRGAATFPTESCCTHPSSALNEPLE